MFNNILVGARGYILLTSNVKYWKITLSLVSIAGLAILYKNYLLQGSESMVASSSAVQKFH